MLLKSQTIIKQEELVRILETQLKKAQSQLTELSKADSKIESVVAELELLLTQHPDYQSVVSDRLKLKEPEPTPMPVRIEIESIESVGELEKAGIFPDPVTPAPTPYTPVEIPLTPRTEEDKILNPTDIGVEEQEEIVTDSDKKIENTPDPSETSYSSEAGKVQQQNTPTIEQMKQQLLSKATRAELDAFKASIGDAKVKEIWESCSIPERNQIKCISQSKVAKRAPATLGYKFHYTAPITKAKYDAIYLGYYLHGQPVEKDNERVIFVEGQAIICTKNDLRPCREQPGISEDERARLEVIISEESDDEPPTTEDIAANTFTGLAPSPKLQTGSGTGNKPGQHASEQNAGVQIELDIKTPEPPELPPTPTPALEAIASELNRFHPQNPLTFTYETTPRSTFLTIKHGDSEVGCFEDDGSDIYEVGNKKLTFHGFTPEQISKAYAAGEAVLESLKQKKA